MISLKTIPAAYIFATLIVALLSSCASVDKKPTSSRDIIITDDAPVVESKTTDSLIEQEKLTEAAMQYLELVGSTSSPLKYDYHLKAIDLLTQDKKFKFADSLLAEIDAKDLNDNQTVYYAYLNSKISIFKRDPGRSEKWLSFVTSQDYSQFANEADLLKLYITTYELASDTKNMVLSRVLLESHILTEQETIENQDAIIRGLLTMEIAELETMIQSESSINLRTWIDLSLLIKKSKNPFRLGNQLRIWQEQNPQHPIKQSIIASLAPQVDDEPPILDNIALLLPLTGAYKNPAIAIRDGFLASYYAESNADIKPTVRIYDTGVPNSNILALYQQAVDEGANIIVGPLRKKAIKEITLNAILQVPTLVLNQLSDSDFYSKNFYQFALSPEDEAQQTAQRAWLDGYNRAAIISPSSKWGTRVTAAFSKEWEKLGGEIVAQTSYESKKSDFAKPIKSLLAIDKSTERKVALSKLLRTRLKFEPRRRQDIDFIFMAAFPKHARLIPPQLKFFHAADIPIYATSQSFSGRLNRKKDRDLDNVIIGDMPWTLTRARNDKYKLQLYRTWPNRTRKLNRLYALGTDAYNILYFLNWLRANNHSTLEGTTGNLHMSENNRVNRELSWAKFKRGRPVLLPATADIPTQ